MAVDGRLNQDLTLIYEGSVKRVFSSRLDEGKLYFEFTDDYSVFDWGKMPDTIANKGRALAVMGAFFFQELSKPDVWRTMKTSAHLKRFDRGWLKERFEHVIYSGVCGLDQFGMPVHYTGLLKDGRRIDDLGGAALSGAAGSAGGAADSAGGADPDLSGHLSMEVLKAEVERPEAHRLDKQIVYFYPHTRSGIARVTPGRRLLPLEIVFRFGMPEGSSLKGRLEKDRSYLSSLGLSKMPEEGEWFAHPVLEFFTKLEPKDRLLTVQEAVHVSGLGPYEFDFMRELALDTALFLYHMFAERGIELWDGKVEMIVDYKGHEPGEKDGGLIMLADSIGPDELRLLYRGVHLSKELIRKIYRGGNWEKSLQKAQEKAKKEGLLDWKKICIEELGCRPEKLDDLSKRSVDALYPALANHLIGKQVFGGQPTLDEFVDALPAKLADGRTIG